ncbi:hypothetical protein AB1Y20_015433 [Prymnesium parvum]|uniref:Uncharacterized protein n=1 Tax=Prymnesium parvum TaxID=97485 RepID=A0AB34K0I3_PRYPA
MLAPCFFLLPQAAILPQVRSWHTLQGPTLPPAAWSRRFVLGSALGFAALPASPDAAHAEYGQAANQRPPALIPSPFVPTGEMAKTCNVVALGREDVCLEPKLLMSAYDKLLLEKAKASTAALIEEGNAEEAKLLPVVREVLELYPLVESGAYTALTTRIDNLSSMLAEIANSDERLKSRLDAFKKGPLAGLKAAGKKGEASPTAKAMIKLSDSMYALVFG